MSMYKITLIGLDSFDSDTLWDRFTLPAGLDREIAKDTILRRVGEFELLYPDLSYMQTAIGNWCIVFENSFKRWKTALDSEYNPIHNFDRYEDYTDTSTGSSSGSAKNISKSSGTIEGKVSAYNVSTYQPSSYQENDSTSETSSTGTTNSKDDSVHKGHLYGNIGVTTNQQMIRADLELYEEYQIYNMIAAAFADEFCVMIYE